MFLLTIFNVVFSWGTYPISWCYSKLIVLYKSGDRLLCNNYRGISIMDTFSKIYDTLILNRLKLWCNIDKCQAGAQRGRGCVEQIMTLRLLCDYAVFKRIKLYVLYIDFSKAYDKVDQIIALDKMREIGIQGNNLK